MATSELSLRYWDKPKRSMTTSASCIFNAGFFGNYDSGSNKHTMPFANLVADIDVNAVIPKAIQDLQGWGCTISGGKIYKGCNQGGPAGKQVSTFYVNQSNNCYISKMCTVSTTMRCAVSGPPVMKNGAVTTWNNDITNEGWDSTWPYNTWHSLLCTTSNSNECYYVAMKTTTANCITSSEAYNTLTSMGLGITNAIMLDGGGSFILKNNWTEVAGTSEDRMINTLGVFGLFL
jgi:hypothetical protein